MLGTIAPSANLIFKSLLCLAIFFEFLNSLRDEILFLMKLTL